MDWKQKLRKLYLILNQKCEYFTLTGWEEREYKKYSATYQYYKQFHGQELQSRYINAQVQYAHQKSILFFLSLLLALIVINGSCKGVFSVVFSVLKSSPLNGDTSSMLLLALGIVIGFPLTASAALYAYARKVRKLYRRILIIEEMLDEDHSPAG